MSNESPPPPSVKFGVGCLSVVLILVAVDLVIPLVVLQPWVGDTVPHAAARACTDCRMIAVALGAYREEYGSFPIGSSRSVLRALHGVNPKRISYLPLKAALLSDPLGNPYRIGIDHLGEPWAYSCGKDKKDDGGAVGSDDIVSWNQ